MSIPLPRIHGTTCGLCHWEVPALGLPPDREMAWFERFERRPCPNCCGMALGLLGGLLLATVFGRRRPAY